MKCGGTGHVLEQPAPVLHVRIFEEWPNGVRPGDLPPLVDEPPKPDEPGVFVGFIAWLRERFGGGR
jgi:hypothetical protein